MPEVDLNDPNLDPAIQQEFRTRELARSQGKVGPNRAGPSGQDTQLLSMIESIGQLDLDEQGGWDFYGVSSGAVFLRRMREHFQGLMGNDSKAPFLPRKEKLPGLSTLDSPASAGSSPFDSISSHGPEMPPKEHARQLCAYSISTATCLIRFVHTPTFWDLFERVYEKPYESYTPEEQRFLGLMFAAMGLGCMYHTLDDDGTRMEYKEAVEQG